MKRLSRPPVAASTKRGGRPTHRGRDAADVEAFVNDFVATLRPNLAQICPEVRSRPEMVHRVIRSSLDLPTIHEQAAKHGYSNDEFIDIIAVAYSNLLATDCR